MVRHHLRRAHAGAGPGLAGDRRRPAHPDPGPHGLGQDPGGVPLGHRPADDRAGAGGAHGSAPGWSTSRRCGPSPSTSRRTCGPRWPASASPPSASGAEVHEPTVGIRTGDTSAEERRRLARHPPDLLITTPESLYLLLTSQARENLVNVQAVIVDEIHALAATKRGAHLALTLERLEHLVAGAGNPAPQRIGLSATQRPLEEIARYLGGFEARPTAASVAIVDAGVRKALDIEVVVPVEDMGQLGEVGGPAQSRWSTPSRWAAPRPPVRSAAPSGRRCTRGCSS